MSANELSELRELVERLQELVPKWVEQCTDPEGRDLAELFHALHRARVELQGVERDVEVATATAMLDDHVQTDTLRVERRRGTERKSWDHDGWKRDVRAKVVQAVGLKGASVVLPTGELLDGQAANELLYGLAQRLQDVHGAGAPKTTALRELGLDARDYCESSPGAWRVSVQLIEGDETGEGDE